MTALSNKDALPEMEQVQELAAIFAAAYLRVRDRNSSAVRLAVPEDSPEPGGSCLEVPPETVLSGDNGVNELREPLARRETWN